MLSVLNCPEEYHIVKCTSNFDFQNLSKNWWNWWTHGSTFLLFCNILEVCTLQFVSWSSYDI